MQGPKGIVQFDSMNATLRLFTEASAGALEIPVPSVDGLDARAAVPKNFVRAVLGQETQHVEREVAINEARILDAAYRSAASGEEALIER